MFKLLLLFALSLVAAFAQEDREVHGRIVDATGRAIEGASIKVRAVTRATGTRYGENPDVDAAAKSDANGNFTLRGQNPFVAVTVSVEAANYARGTFAGVGAGTESHELKLLEGVSIIGTLVKSGQPVPNIPIRATTTEASEIFALDLSAKTDERGRFRFANLPPKQDSFLFAPMSALQGQGSVPVQRITGGADGAVLDLGEVSMQQAFTIDGEIRAPTNISNVRVTLGREDVNDTLEATTDTRGRFHFEGLPAEIIGLKAAIPNHRLSLSNGSLFAAKPDRLLGRLVTNKTGLILEFEVGAELPPLNIDSAALRNEPLLGAESEPPLPDSIKVTGQVFDAETKQPLREFTVSEGRYNRRGQVDWFFTRERPFTNGSFTLFLPHDAHAGAIFVGADDHLPFTSLGVSAPTNFIISLKPGVQPRGTILEPDGRPATNVMVYLAGADQVVSIRGKMEVEGNGLRRTRADQNGAFNFPQRGDESALVAFNDNGFIEAPVTQLRTNHTLRLQRWARLEGALKLGEVAGLNQTIVLNSMPPPYQWYPREVPAVNVVFAANTDIAGHFVFEKAPPILAQVSHSPSFDNQIHLERQSQSRRVLLRPGETAHVDLGGEGRTLVGRVTIPGYEDKVRWNTGSQLELIQQGGPSETNLTNLLAKLRATSLRTNETERARAEDAYQAERKSVAERAREFYATDAGLKHLLGSRRYLIEFNDDGSFEARDVPPGKYRVNWLFTGNTPIMVAGFPIFLEQTLEVPPSTNGDPRAVFDLGEIKLTPPAPPSPKK